MLSTTRALTVFLVSTLFTITPLVAGARDWPAWSGPSGDRTSLGNGLFDREAFGLKTDWVKTLGSGYSGIAIADGIAVTGFSDGESDFVAALNVATGAERWRHRLGKAYKGHSGSDDGPTASPTIHDGSVFMLGPWGRVLALDLESGKELWSHQIDEEYGAVAPEYGFSSSPAVVQGVVVVQTGGPDGHCVSGFDRKTGKLLWSTGDDPVTYESPLGITLGGREQVLAVTGKNLIGLVPTTGEVLWQHEHGVGDGDGLIAQPVKVGSDGILLMDWDGTALFRLALTDGRYQIEERWKNNSFGRSYAIPVAWRGYIYGYRGQFLTCVNAETGEVAWKSRPPGRGTLILVDGRLVIQAESGDLVIAEASPEGYREKTRVEALDRGYLTSPSFADGRVYARNLTQIASLSVTDRMLESATSAAVDPDELLGKFGDWVRGVETADNKQKLIDRFLAEQKRFPVVEGDNLVHFVFRGDVPDLALTGPIHQAGDLPMHRVEGTDFYYRSLRLEPASFYEYRLTVFDESRVDPLNPNRFGPEDSEQSFVTTGGWRGADHLAEPEGDRGELIEYQWKSEILEDERTVQIYLPPGYSENSGPYPLLVVNHGDQELSWALMNNTLDNLIGKSVAPLIAVFVPRNAFPEYAGALGQKYVQALAEELIPYLESQYSLASDARARGIMGVGSAGYSAMWATFTRPALFTRAASQSFYDGDTVDELMAAIRKAEPSDLHFFVQWSRRDYRNDRGLDAEEDSRELAELLESKGHAVTRHEIGGSPAWGAWRSENDKVLEALFPLEN